MTREEYERRKLQLEAARRAGLELIEAAHQAQLRALELVWLAGGDGAAAVAALPPPPGRAAVEPPRPAPVAVAAPSPPARPPRRKPGQLWEDVRAAIDRLPDTFSTTELLLALGYPPHRGSLHRILGELTGEGEIELVLRGEGSMASRYRKLRRGNGDTSGGPGTTGP